MDKIIAKSTFNRTALLVFKVLLTVLITIWLGVEKPEYFWLFTSLGFLIVILLILLPRESTMILDEQKLTLIEYSYFGLRPKEYNYLISELQKVDFLGRKPHFEKGIGLHNLAIEVAFPSSGSQLVILLKDGSKSTHPCFPEKSSLKKLFKILSKKLPITQ